MQRFIPKGRRSPVRVRFLSGPRLVVSFFAELGAALVVASTVAPERNISCFASGWSFATSQRLAVVRLPTLTGRPDA